jgi:hypothetical protein
MKYGSALRFWLRLLPVCLVLALLGACGSEERDKVIGEGYIGSPTAGLRDRLGPAGSSTAILKAGDHVHILQRRRRWVRVRTPAGAEGWLEERHIIPRGLYEQAQGLVKSSAGLPPQGQAKARSDVNLHLEPARKSPSFFQLKEGEICEVVAHSAVEVPIAGGVQKPVELATGEPGKAAPGQPGQPAAQTPAKPPPPPQPPAKQPASAKKAAKKEKGHKAKHAEPAGPKKEDWFLVRAKGKAGWALARMIEMSIPDEVAQYAEGKAITAWQVLDEVPDGDQKKPRYIWATSEHVGSPCDFDGIRVFIWNKGRHRYETSYHERNQQGAYPITVGKVKLKSGEFPAFSITTVDDAGNRKTRNFVLLGNVVRRREKVE